MPRFTYTPVPVGLDLQGGGVQNATPRRLSGTIQEITFGTSMVAQLTTLVLSFIALSQGGLPDVLSTVLVLETVVQGVELVWYTVIGALYFFGYYSISVATRYLDWFVTTPVMLTSIMLFSLWDADKNCVTMSNVLSDGSRVAALICIIIADWLMLGVGLSYEAKIERVTSMLDKLVGGMNGLWLGFVPFIGAFIPLFIIGGQGASKSPWSILSVVLTFVSWLFYGIVALYVLDPENRNTAYNLLDIVSKNAVGIIISSVALGNDFNTTGVNCTSA